uniref:CUB domain-containing protein n=1 Tax=Mesocestoides corti TaxID=53468 RepID=A0A5K3FT52_MESCO
MFAGYFWLVVICILFVVASTNSSEILHDEFDVKSNEIVNFSMSNYTLLLSRDSRHVWKFRAENGSRITIRKRFAHLYPGDKISVFDVTAGRKSVIAIYQAGNSSENKITSFSDTVSMEFSPSSKVSPLSLGMEKYKMGFSFTFEVAGFCSIDNNDRKSCAWPDNFCYSVSEDRCDGWWDCPVTGSDEIGCHSCGPSEYSCSNSRSTNSSCYTFSERCNGVYHCDDKSDEMGCGDCSITSLRFLCVSLNSTNLSDLRGECISLDRICDSQVDCANGSDESSDLCNSTYANASSHLRHSSIAQQIAKQVALRIVDDAIIAASSRLDSRLRTLLTYVLSALLGPLLVIMTVGFMCKGNNAAVNTVEARRARRQARFNSPIQRLIRDEIRRRPPPPTYDEALNNSLFEEPVLEGVPPPAPPDPRPGALSQARIATVRELSMKPAPTFVDVAVSCNLQVQRRCEPTPTEAAPQTFITPVPAHPPSRGLLGRWLLSALRWRRGGERGDYEQPEVSEATVASFMHEDGELGSILSRRESVNGNDDRSPETGTRDATSAEVNQSQVALALEHDLDGDEPRPPCIHTPLLVSASAGERGTTSSLLESS